MNTKRMLKAVLFTPGPKGRWGIPMLVEGDPGSAKSSIVEQASAAFGLDCIPVIASIREPADFSGLPMLTKGDRVKRLPADEWVYRFMDADRGVLFLDELNTAPEAVQAALLRVVLERQVGDVQLPAGIRILAAQNEVQDAAGGHDLSMPLANRFLHWHWETPSVRDWQQWLLAGAGCEVEAEFDAGAEEERVLAAWPKAFAKAAALVSGFATKRPELINKKPQVGSPDASKAWPSFRSWEMATRVLAGAEIHDLSEEERDALISGCVGQGAAAEFVAYISDLDFPDLHKLLDGAVEWKADKRLDRTLAVLNGCAAVVVDKACERRNERAEKLWTLLDQHVKHAADVVLPAATSLLLNRLAAFKVATGVLVKLQPMLEAAGIDFRR